MFNGKALLLLVLALVAGGGAARYAHNWLQTQTGGATAEVTETVDVIVAAREIPFGIVIEESHLRATAWPKDSVPPETFTTKEDVVGKMLNQSAMTGEPLLTARVVEKLEGSRLSALIAPNMRAITVRVNDVAGVAGFLLPGNRVDILSTRMVTGRAKTETLLQNIKVLAIDQKADRDKDEPVVVRAVTLEANLEQASKLTAATQEGSIQLILRNPEDDAMTIEPTPIATAPKARPLDTRKEITIIRGTSVNQSKVKL